MQTCSQCLYTSDHPFGLTFFGKICSGCVTHKEKDSLNWESQKDKLSEQLKKIRTTKRTYDCVVPVVGDAEDYYVLSRVLDLKLAPLVVCVNDYFKNNIGWYNLHNLITHFDVDSLTFNPDMRVYKELIKISMQKHNHILLPFLQLHTAFPVHIAKERQIPLIIWGQHQAIEQVGKFSHLDNVQMSDWSRHEHDIFGTEPKRLIGNGAQLNEQHLNYYEYPAIRGLGNNKITGVYLSNFYRWDPLKQNSDMVSYGYQPQHQSSTFDAFERAGSSVYYGLHDLLKYQRRGYRKINDHVTREIRHGRISINDGRKIAEQFSSQKAYIRPFFDWLGVTKSGYDWYLKFKMAGLEHLISHEPISPKSLPCHEQPINFQDIKIEDALMKCTNPCHEFVVNGKGI